MELTKVCLMFFRCLGKFILPFFWCSCCCPLILWLPSTFYLTCIGFCRGRPLFGRIEHAHTASGRPWSESQRQGDNPQSPNPYLLIAQSAYCRRLRSEWAIAMGQLWPQPSKSNNIDETGKLRLCTNFANALLSIRHSIMWVVSQRPTHLVRPPFSCPPIFE